MASKARSWRPTRSLTSTAWRAVPAKPPSGPTWSLRRRPRRVGDSGSSRSSYRATNGATTMRRSSSRRASNAYGGRSRAGPTARAAARRRAWRCGRPAWPRRMPGRRCTRSLGTTWSRVQVCATSRPAPSSGRSRLARAPSNRCSTTASWPECVTRHDGGAFFTCGGTPRTSWPTPAQIWRCSSECSMNCDRLRSAEGMRSLSMSDVSDSVRADRRAA